MMDPLRALRAAARHDNNELGNGSRANTEVCNLLKDVLISPMNPVAYA